MQLKLISFDIAIYSITIDFQCIFSDNVFINFIFQSEKSIVFMKQDDGVTGLEDGVTNLLILCVLVLLVCTSTGNYDNGVSSIIAVVMFNYLKLISPQPKLIPKNQRQEVKHVAKSKIAPNWRVFVIIFGQEIEEKVEKYSQSGYCSSTITYLKIISETKTCQFVDISDSAMRSISGWWFFDILVFCR